MQFLSSFISREQGGIISLVGSGGKTSLMFALAGFLAGEGKRVLTTTTTKIRWPGSEQSPLTACSRDPLQWILNHSKETLPDHITLTADYDLRQEKMLGYSPETIDQLAQSGFLDWILVEADGAAGRPLKAPGHWEPVPCGASTHVIAVVGLDGMYGPLRENRVFRSEAFSVLSGLGHGETVTPEAACRVLTAEDGLFRGAPCQAERIVFLNMAETVERFRAGRVMAGLLSSLGFTTFIGSLVEGWLRESGPVARGKE